MSLTSLKLQPLSTGRGAHSSKSDETTNGLQRIQILTVLPAISLRPSKRSSKGAASATPELLQLLQRAPQCCSLEDIRAAINRDGGASINAKGALTEFHQSIDWTPLHHAIYNGFGLEVIRLLVESGANINAKTDRGYTPLHTLIIQRENMCDIDVLLYLLDEAKVHINATDNSGRTPLYYTFHKDRNIHAALLIDRGASVRTRDNAGRTPLHEVCICCDCDDSVRAAHFMLSKGADVNAKDNRGWTPLHLAAYNSVHNSLTCMLVPILIAHGADKNAENKDGDTPLGIARKRYDDGASNYFHNGALHVIKSLTGKAELT